MRPLTKKTGRYARPFFLGPTVLFFFSSILTNGLKFGNHGESQPSGGRAIYKIEFTN